MGVLFWSHYNTNWSAPVLKSVLGRDSNDTLIKYGYIPHKLLNQHYFPIILSTYSFNSAHTVSSLEDVNEDLIKELKQLSGANIASFSKLKKFCK